MFVKMVRHSRFFENKDVSGVTGRDRQTLENKRLETFEFLNISESNFVASTPNLA